MTTSDKIRELIAERSLTQRQFAELVGIHYITLGNNLNKDDFSSKSIEKIASACGLSMFDLLPSEEEKKVVLTKVSGYLESNGEIVKINDLKSLRKFLEKINRFIWI